MKRIQLENRTDLANEIPLSTPYVIFIDPTNACTLRCKFCMNSKIKSHNVMGWDEYCKIIDSLDEFDKPVKTIRLYGFGEPLLHPFFPEMVTYAKKSNKVINVDTTTNGIRFNSFLNRKIIDSGIDRINLSINGLSNQQYKEFTGRDIDFYSLVKNIEHLYSIKEKTIIFIKANGDYLSDEDKQKFYNIFKPISDGCELEHTASCWYDTKIENINQNVGIYGQPLENVQVCPYIFYSIMIHADQHVSTCFLDWNKQMILGRIQDNSIKEIWMGEILKRFQIDMLRGIKTPICSGCNQLQAGMPVNIDAEAENILRRIQNVNI